jgi:hypothetical protein
MNGETERVDVGIPENWKLLFDKELTEKRLRLEALRAAKAREAAKQ